MNAVMTPGRQREVFLVCVRASLATVDRPAGSGTAGDAVGDGVHGADPRTGSTITAGPEPSATTRWQQPGRYEERTPGRNAAAAPGAAVSHSAMSMVTAILLFELERRAQG